MCGIAGFIDFNNISDGKLLREMTDTLAMRGPDDSGYYFSDSDSMRIGLGHRRLSILDLSAFGHQPMSFDNLVIVYNGEVYNYKTIRLDLEKHGYIFESDSDTEVVLKSFHKWGRKAIDRFNGMFSIAILDKKEKKITLIRDRAGVKPLYYYQNNGLFLFGSELKSFHPHPEFNKVINKSALRLYLKYGYIPQPHCIFENTYKLLSGHILEYDLKNGDYSIEKYWDIIDFYNQPKIHISESEALQETEKLLLDACKQRMVSDVPVGVFLSGGYDSSTVTALLQANNDKKIKTFTIGFHEKNYNEAKYAKNIATYLGTDHTEYYCTQKDALEILPKIPDIWDEPMGDSSVIPTVLVSQLARKSVTVSLSADGGDEIFGGYNKYLSAKQSWQKLSKFDNSRFLLSRLISSVNPNHIPLFNKTYNYKTRFYKLQKLLSSKDCADVVRISNQMFSDLDINEIINESSKPIWTGFEDSENINSNIDDFDLMMAIDFKTYLTDDILTKVDRASMSVGLEGREPLLDYRLVEFISSLPINLKIRDGGKKYILKEIAHKYIPKNLLDRPKMGFGAPIVNWLKDDLDKYLLYYFDEKRIKEQGIFSHLIINELYSNYLNGKKESVGKIWYLLVFQMWHEKWMTS